MRRLISFLLVLVFMLSLSCVAFATDVDSIPGKAPANPSESPKTGDVIMTWVIVLLISLIALVAVAVIFRKVFSR